MANEIAVTTAGRVNVVGFPIMQRTLNCAEAILAGDVVRVVPSSTGAAQFTKGNATATVTTPETITGEAQIYGVATHSANAGQALTAIRKGKMSGWTFSQAYGAVVWLSDTDGRLSEVAGTINLIIGHIVPTTANPRGDAEDKILEIDITGIVV
jgi:hypothetical protein